jgi:hypothetical protein
MIPGPATAGVAASRGGRVDRHSRVRREVPTLDEPAAEARQRGQPAAQSVDAQVLGGHVVQPPLDRRRRQVEDPGEPPFPRLDEDEELLDVPPVGPDPSFRSRALLALVGAELLDQLDELLGHALGPPHRATTTLSPVGSMGSDDPPVKRRKHELIGTALQQGRQPVRFLAMEMAVHLPWIR